jgi:DnaK suppressor protein
MNSRDLKYFKKRLNKWLDVLLHQSNTTIDGMRKCAEHPIDMIDQAALENERTLVLQIRTREQFLILKIQQSLRDIDSGNYGIFEICGDRIGVKRLKARPVTRHCIYCKTQMEKKSAWPEIKLQLKDGFFLIESGDATGWIQPAGGQL